MAMADWIHKYPGVAALLHTEEDVLEDDARDDRAVAPGGAPLPPLGDDLHAWATAVLEHAQAARETYAAQGCFLLVAPDVAARLARDATPPAVPGILHWDPAHARAPLRLAGLVQIIPWEPLPAGTVVFHWSRSARFMRWEPVASGRGVWSHVVWARGDAGGTGEADVLLTLPCTAQHGDLVCPCGGFLLRWR